MTPKTVSPHVSGFGLLRLFSTTQCWYTSSKVAFYKSFSRPAAKVFLGAIFVYQSAYWVWTKLETDEIRQLKTGTYISKHADRINSLNIHVDEILSLEREIQQTIERKSSASGIWRTTCQLHVTLGFISIPAFWLKTAGDFSNKMLNRGPIEITLPFYEKWSKSLLIRQTTGSTFLIGYLTGIGWRRKSAWRRDI